MAEPVRTGSDPLARKSSTQYGVVLARPRCHFTCDPDGGGCGEEHHGWPYKVKSWLQPDAPPVYEICVSCWLRPRIPPMPPLMGKLHEFRRGYYGMVA